MEAIRLNKSSILADIPEDQRPQVLLDRALELGALPASVQKLLELTRRDDAEIAPVVDALSENPALVAAVLRTANSPVYGQSRGIADLRRAVTLIGMQELHDLVAGSAMLAAFSTPDPTSERIQSRALVSALIAHKLSLRHGGSPSSAYLSGLLCELGALACLALDPSFKALYEESERNLQQRFAQEQARYGCATPALAGSILRENALPEAISAAIATSGLAPSDENGRDVAFARLAAMLLQSASEHRDPEQLKSELAAAANAVGIADIAIDTLTSVCLAAATAAGISFEGKLAELASLPHEELAPKLPSRSAAKAGPKSLSRVYALGAAVVALVAVGAWLFLRS